MSVHFSSERGDWATPQGLFDELAKRWGGFDLDPCCWPETAKCDRFYTPADDGLAMPWAPAQVFMNPPYGREIGPWVEKAFTEAQLGAVVVGLLPARTDTAWWHDYVMRSAAIYFIRGRVRFEGADHPAPFPSVIVEWRMGELIPFIGAIQAPR